MLVSVVFAVFMRMLPPSSNLLLIIQVSMYVTNLIPFGSVLI